MKSWRFVGHPNSSVLISVSLFLACGESVSPQRLDTSSLDGAIVDSTFGVDAGLSDSGQDGAGSADARMDGAAEDAGPTLPDELAQAIQDHREATRARANYYCDCFGSSVSTRALCGSWIASEPLQNCWPAKFGTPGRNLANDVAYHQCMSAAFNDLNRCLADSPACAGGAWSECNRASSVALAACEQTYEAGLVTSVEEQSSRNLELCWDGAPEICNSPSAPSSATGESVFSGSIVGRGDDFWSAGRCSAEAANNGTSEFSGADVALHWRAPETAQYIFDTRGSNDHFVVSARSSCDANAEVLTCAGTQDPNDPYAFYSDALAARFVLDAVQGQTYLVVVDALGFARDGNFQINIHRTNDVSTATADIENVDLDVDLASLRGVATLSVRGTNLAGSTEVLLEVGDLAIEQVVVDQIISQRTEFVIDRFGRRQLRVGLLPAGLHSVAVTYTMRARTSQQGLNVQSGWTYSWPNFCGNLFPCESDPTDGATYSIRVTGLPTGATAVFPSRIAQAVPAYVPAIAFGNYERLNLGTTTAGTTIRAWYLPGEQTAMAQGTSHLVTSFAWLEENVGAYPFGREAGSVSVRSGMSGIEHHPYWHIGTSSLSDENTHAHEAAHGWFGNGVRMACWEDFVLSEGTATYLAARALGSQDIDQWAGYECAVKDACENANTIAYPEGCNDIDIIRSPLWSNAPYYKGAFFYRRVADLLGAARLDTILANFYRTHLGEAKTMQSMVDFIKARATSSEAAQIDLLDQAWLRSLECPAEVSEFCQQ